MPWNLVKKTYDGMYNKHKKENEVVYHYQRDKTDLKEGKRQWSWQTVAFHSHPTQAFSYVLVQGDKKDFNRVVEAFVAQAMAKERFGGSFDEAIKVLYTDK